MSLSNFPTSPETSTGSWNSAKFRKMLLIESIASVFCKSNSTPAVLPNAGNGNDRNESTSTNATGQKTLVSNELIVEKGARDVMPSPTSVQTFDGSKSAIISGNEGDESTDPMVGRVEGGINYRSLRWWQAGMLMIAETISLGILSLPATLAKLGLIPGLFLLCGLGALASYTGYVIGQFKFLHPHVHSMGDAGALLFGRWGGEILGIGQLLFVVFIMGSHILTFSIMMNVLTENATCTIVFMVIGMLISLVCTLPRTLRGLTWLCVASFASIITAVGATMIGVAISQPARQYKQGILEVLPPVGLWPEENISFHKAFSAVSNIVFAYAGHVAFFSFISEFRRPRDFPKALALLQCSDITMYLVSSIVIYRFAGGQVRSPALDSASPVVRKVAWGLAMPTIVIAGVVNGHVAVKYLFVRLLREGGWLAKWSNRKANKNEKNKQRISVSTNGDNSNNEGSNLENGTQPPTQSRAYNEEEDLLHSKGAKAWSIWIAIVVTLWVLAWVISEGVPVFEDLLGLTSALFASWFTYGLMGMMWFHMNLRWKGRAWRSGVAWRNPGDAHNWRKWVMLAVNVLCIIIGAIMCFAGLYSSGLSMKENAAKGKCFSC